MLHTMILGSTGRPKSLRDELTQEQQQALDTWAAAQTPNERGFVDMMRWPGWADALQENIRNKK